MKRKSWRLAGWALGLSLAMTGLGAAVGVSKSPVETRATETAVTFSTLGFSNQQAMTTIDGPDFTITFDKGSNNSNPPKYYTSGSAIRAYAGNTFRLDVPSGMTALAITFGDSDGSNAITASAGTYNNGSWSGDATSVTFTIGGSSGNRRLSSFTVTTKTESSPIESIALNEGTVRKSYVDGDSISSSGVKAIATLENKKTVDVTVDCTITPNVTKATLGLTSVTYTATYDGSGSYSISPLDVSISVAPLAVQSIEIYGTPKTDFKVDDVFSLGSAKIQVNYNNETNEKNNLDAEGVTYTINGVDCTGVHYMEAQDAGKTVVISYAGFSTSYSIGTVTESEPVASGYYQLVKLQADISVGSTYIIVNTANSAAMSKTQNNNNRGKDTVTIDTEKERINSVLSTTEIITLTAGNKASTYGLQTSDGKYLYAASSKSNHLKTQDALDDNASFAISIDASGDATIVAQGTNTRNNLRFNASDNIFSCYGSGQLDVQLYKFVASQKPQAQTDAEAFANNYLHFSGEGAVNANDRRDTNACRADGEGAQSWYSTAVTYFNETLSQNAREWFATSQDTLMVKGRARLLAWAAANNESVDFAAETYVLEAHRGSIANTIQEVDYTPAVACVAAFGLVSVAGIIILPKRKKDK